MDKKFLLTSIIALGFAGPAMAAFPTDGLMEKGQVYTDAANISSWGSTIYKEGDTVYANAVYTLNTYTPTPGEYLPESSEIVKGCESGYYCPGGSFNYSTTQDQERYACSSLSGGYGSSDSGAIWSGQCYKSCVNTGKAASMTGKNYYAYGLSTCEPASCAQGWTLRSGSSESMNSATIGNDLACFTVHTLDNGNYSRNYDSSLCPEDSGAAGIMMGEASFYDMSSSNNLPGEWAVNYGYQHGSVRGIARLSEVSGTPASAGVNSASNVNPTIKTTAELGAERGTNCYCTITGYRPYSNQGNPEMDKWRIVNSSWAYAGTSNSLGACAGSCASVMRTVGANDLVYRSALLGSITSVQVPATCAANNITIVWNAIIEDKLGLAGGGSMTWIGNNTASSNVSYDGDIATPTNALQKPGKTFSGWRFSTTAAPAEQ